MQGAYYRRHGIVHARQWHKPGDHPAVLQGVHTTGGMLDLLQAQPYSRRHVEAGDWVIQESDGRFAVVTDAEFKRCYEGV